MTEVDAALVTLIDALHQEGGIELLSIKLSEQLCKDGKNVDKLYGVEIKT